jgi:peptide/nickel transport system substrate-binding protein
MSRQGIGKLRGKIASSRVGRSWRAFALAAAMSLAPPAVGAQEVLRVPLVADIGSFDPDNGFEIGAVSAINNVYEGLVEYAPGTTEIVGLLAQSWDVSADGLTYAFHLVDGVKFHDGMQRPLRPRCSAASTTNIC